MPQDITLQLSPKQAADEGFFVDMACRALAVKPATCKGFHILKKTIDARSKNIVVNLSLRLFINEPVPEYPVERIVYPDVRNSSHEVHIVGAGPAGLFAALQCIELGLRPIVIERGKDVRARRRDLAALNKEGILNEESNYCFGEGGAGTYSDGKLYTRSNKRGSIKKILSIFYQFGADESILYNNHPHIGTNKLPHIITAMRNQILESGGQVLFETRLLDIEVKDKVVTAVHTSSGKMDCKHLILASGHSAKDIYTLLFHKGIALEVKPFALGVRVEHPQALINCALYRDEASRPYLPPASYTLVQQVNQKGVFSFCMCPGGIIAPASTEQGALVVNGWSPSKRNNPFANSGIVVSVDEHDFKPFKKYGALQGMYFQHAVEKNSFDAGGGKFVAPAQRLADFVQGRQSTTLPANSYLPGLRAANLHEVLPKQISAALQKGFNLFGQKIKNYVSNEAIVVATESRTSSPVKIPRDSKTMMHTQIKGLYPCAEGAGYSGGIVSAAMDGENVALAVYQNIVQR